MRVSLFGTGRIGRLHARLLAGLEGVELVVADPDTARAAEVAAETRSIAAPSPAAAFDGADAVVVAAATDAHAELVRTAAARGLATFCEKPLAQDLATSIDVARAVEDAGIPFQLGFQRRFDAGYAEARRLLASGELGTLYGFALNGHDPEPPPAAYIPVSGGLFRDFSIHDFDIIRWLTGHEVDEVYATGSIRAFKVFAEYGDVDTAAVTLRMDDGAVGTLTVARHDPLGYDIRTELFGSRDSVSVGLGPRMPIRSVEPGVPPPAGPAWPNFLDRFGAAYAAELVAFVRVAAGAEPSPCTARDGVQALRIAEADTRSLHEHRPVRLEEIPGG